VVRGGRVSQGAVGVQGHRAVRPLRDARDRQGVPIHVGVVGQHVDPGRRVLVGGGRVVAGDRRVVDRADGDPHGGGRKAAVAVADGVGERIAAVVVRGGGVGQRAVGIPGDGAVGALGHGGDRQGVAVHVGVVGEHVDGGGGVLVGGGYVIPR